MRSSGNQRPSRQCFRKLANRRFDQPNSGTAFRSGRAALFFSRCPRFSCDRSLIVGRDCESACMGRLRQRGRPNCIAGRAVESRQGFFGVHRKRQSASIYWKAPINRTLAGSENAIPFARPFGRKPWIVRYSSDSRRGLLRRAANLL